MPPGLAEHRCPPRLSPSSQIEELEKRYQALRPLRLRGLTVAPAERVAIVGVDGGAAEVLVNLVTGASLADRGVVRVQGRSNADIMSGDDWLASLDRFGIVSPRAILLDGATLEQNLAMPFTLQIDPLAPETIERVALLAEECGLIDRGSGEGGGARIWESWPARPARSVAPARTWREPSRSIRCCWYWSTRRPTCPPPRWPPTRRTSSG